MAVPGRVMDEEDTEEENALFEEEGLVELDSDTPPHLRGLASASQLGDVDALRLALGTFFLLIHLNFNYNIFFLWYYYSSLFF